MTMDKFCMVYFVYHWDIIFPLFIYYPHCKIQIYMYPTIFVHNMYSGNMILPKYTFLIKKKLENKQVWDFVQDFITD